MSMINKNEINKPVTVKNSPLLAWIICSEARWEERIEVMWNEVLAYNLQIQLTVNNMGRDHKTLLAEYVVWLMYGGWTIFFKFSLYARSHFEAKIIGLSSSKVEQLILACMIKGMFHASKFVYKFTFSVDKFSNNIIWLKFSRYLRIFFKNLNESWN